MIAPIAAWVKEHVQRKHQFLLVISTVVTHAPYTLPKAWLEEDLLPKQSKPAAGAGAGAGATAGGGGGGGDMKKQYNLYLNGILKTDQFLRKLDAVLSKDTVLIITGDQ